MADSQNNTLSIPIESKLPREKSPAPLTDDKHLDNHHIEVGQVESLPQPEKQPLLPVRIRERKPKHEESLIAAICGLLVEHQIGKTLEYALFGALSFTCC